KETGMRARTFGISTMSKDLELIFAAADPLGERKRQGRGDRLMGERAVSRTRVRKAAALAAVLILSALAAPALAMPVSGSDTVQGLYDHLLSTMKNGRTLGQSGRFVQLEPVVRRTFDIASMARLSVGYAWTGLTDAQRQQVTESYGRYISAIYAERFDNY